MAGRLDLSFKMLGSAHSLWIPSLLFVEVFLHLKGLIWSLFKFPSSIWCCFWHLKQFELDYMDSIIAKGCYFFSAQCGLYFLGLLTYLFEFDVIYSLIANWLYLACSPCLVKIVIFHFSCCFGHWQHSGSVSRSWDNQWRSPS